MYLDIIEMTVIGGDLLTRQQKDDYNLREWVEMFYELCILHSALDTLLLVLRQ